jgi:hypothetical protein
MTAGGAVPCGQASAVIDRRYSRSRRANFMARISRRRSWGLPCLQLAIGQPILDGERRS